MAYHDDEDEKKKDDPLSEDAIEGVLADETDEDDIEDAPDLLDDEKAWE